VCARAALVMQVVAYYYNVWKYSDAYKRYRAVVPKKASGNERRDADEERQGRAWFHAWRGACVCLCVYVCCECVYGG